MNSTRRTNTAIIALVAIGILAIFLALAILTWSEANSSATAQQNFLLHYSIPKDGVTTQKPSLWSPPELRKSF